jgi:HECT-domain (ubiquitin-transferase)
LYFTILGLESTVVVSSKSSSHRFVKKSLIQIGDYGWRTRKTSFTLILMRMQLKVSIFISPYLISHTYSLSVAAHSLNWYRFIGRILGKAMYEGILVDVAFAGFFLAKVKSDRMSLHLSFNVQYFFSGWGNKVS